MRKELKFIELIKLSVVFQRQRWIFLQNFNFKNFSKSNWIYDVRMTFSTEKKFFRWKKIEKVSFSLSLSVKWRKTRERKINILASKNNNEIIPSLFCSHMEKQKYVHFCKKFSSLISYMADDNNHCGKDNKKNQNLMHSTHWMNEWMNIVSGNQRNTRISFHSHIFWNYNNHAMKNQKKKKIE